MHAGAGQPAGRRFRRVGPPGREILRRVQVARMPFDMQQPAEPPLGDDRLHRLDGRQEAAVVADRQRHAGGAAGLDRGDRLGPRQRQRLLAEHRLARRRHRLDLRQMRAVRRGEHHRLHRRVRQHRVEAGGEAQPVSRGDRRAGLRHGGRRHGRSEEARAGPARHPAACAPPAQADDAARCDPSRFREFAAPRSWRPRSARRVSPAAPVR